MNLFEMLKENYFIRMIYYLPQKLKWNKLNKKICIESQKRMSGIVDNRFDALRELKNKYNGKRCFIVATGPSLQLRDLEMISSEISFSMNSICKIYPETNWRPTFYGIQDIFVYPKMENEIKKYYSDEGTVFISDELDSLYNIPERFIKYPFNAAYHLYDQQLGKFYSKFSGNAYDVVYDGYSITYSLIQIAVFLGFTEIYLLGADCNYQKGGKNHFIESGHYDKKEYLNHDKMITGYSAAKEYADKHGIKIINCTRGGMLEVFPRKSLEEVLGEK